MKRGNKNMIYHFAELDKLRQTQTLINKEWVPARPINYKHRTLWELLVELWLVASKRADLLIWPKDQ